MVSHRPLALKIANPFGLFDMHGNVDEWCQDHYAGGYYTKSPPVDPPGAPSGGHRATRGGGTNSKAAFCRSAARVPQPPVQRTEVTGFRVLRAPRRLLMRVLSPLDRRRPLRMPADPRCVSTAKRPT